MNISVSYFSGESGKGEVEFEIWKYEVGCLIRSGMYRENVVLEAVRRSLKGKSRTVLLHLGEWATIGEVMRETEGMYGDVCSAEELKERFYSAVQREGECVVDFSLRLERLLCSYNMDLDRESRNEMLRTRLWSGLKSHELKNVSRFKYEPVKEYVQLRIDLRQIEQDLEGSKRQGEGCREGSGKRVSERVKEGSKPDIHQHSVQVDNKVLKQLEELTREMKVLDRRVETVEHELKENKSVGRRKGGYERESGGQGRREWNDNRRGGNGRESGGQDRGEKPANTHLDGKKPSPQGR